MSAKEDPAFSILKENHFLPAMQKHFIGHLLNMLTNLAQGRDLWSNFVSACLQSDATKQ